MSSEILPGKRLQSLDAFRGFTIAGMILVNNPGDWGHVFSPLLHAKWHGLTPTDLIFPFFLFIVGVAITYSLEKYKTGERTGQIYRRIFRRTVILFGLGLFLNAFPFFHFSELRIPGVLQRIAIVYCIASLIYLHINRRWQIITSAGILIMYWLALKIIPVPGYGAGLIDQPEGNLCWYIDSHLLAGHTWIYAPAPGFDPEGLLSTIPAIVTAMIGVFTGEWLRKRLPAYQTLVGLFVSANMLIMAGIIIDIWFPFNKNLWSSSYVLVTGGIALHFLGMFYLVIDVKGFRKWAKPLFVYGMNPITVYVLSGLVGRLTIYTHIAGGKETIKSWLFHNLFQSWLPEFWSSLAYALSYVIIWLGLMWILYRKKIFIKV